MGACCICGFSSDAARFKQGNCTRDFLKTKIEWQQHKGFSGLDTRAFTALLYNCLQHLTSVRYNDFWGILNELELCAHPKLRIVNKSKIWYLQMAVQKRKKTTTTNHHNRMRATDAYLCKQDSVSLAITAQLMRLNRNRCIKYLLNRVY